MERPPRSCAEADRGHPACDPFASDFSRSDGIITLIGDIAASGAGALV